MEVFGVEGVGGEVTSLRHIVCLRLIHEHRHPSTRGVHQTQTLAFAWKK